MDEIAALELGRAQLVDHHRLGALDELGRHLDAVAIVRAHGRDKGGRLQPGRVDDRLVAGRDRDHDVGAADSGFGACRIDGLHTQLLLLLGGEQRPLLLAPAVDAQLLDLEDSREGEGLRGGLPAGADQRDRRRGRRAQRTSGDRRGGARPVRPHEVRLDQSLQRPVEPEHRDEEADAAVGDGVGLQAGALAAREGGEHHVQ